jgi:CheY-like chemotaxis protein
LVPKKVLVVDDDENTRRFLSVALEENGYDAVTAEDGDDGLKKIQSESPDLILLDVMMPKKTGFSLFKQLRRKDEYKDIPVIMLTGVAGVLEEEEMAAEGDTSESPFDSLRASLRVAIQKMREEGLVKPERFIDKPIDPEELIDAVDEILSEA